MSYFAIGLMSGTSLDGLDLCYAKFTESQQNWDFEILASETLPYSVIWENKLRNAFSVSAPELAELHSEYGFYLGKNVNEFIKRHNIEHIDVIGSHGHTIFHQPKKKFTVQIGDGRAIKLLTKLPVVYDFRTQDVLMEGNGAPLVPIGDHYLFSNYDACLNLGGFSNISFIHDSKRIAFDICPVNIVLNALAKQKGKSYDENGELAKQGIINSELLEKLNALSYYQESPPKSLGIEWVNQYIFPLLNQFDTETALATFTQHSAEKMAELFNRYQLKSVLITGGGAFNSYLIEKLKRLSKTEITIPNSGIVNFKEALIFAFMGVLRIQNKVNIFSSATGSSEDHSSGSIV